MIFQEKLLKGLKCYNFLWVQRRHNCFPAVSFANCVMTLYLLKVHLQTFLSIPITQKCQIPSCDTLVANERYEDNNITHLVQNTSKWRFKFVCESEIQQTGWKTTQWILTLNIPSLGRQRCLPSWGPRRTPWFFCNYSTVWCGRLFRLCFWGFWNYNSVIQELLVSNILCLFISTEVSQ